MPKELPADSVPAMMAGMIAALVDRHGQMDIHLRKLHLTVPGSQLGLELDGKVTVSLHLRDLTDAEKQAHVQSNVAAIRS